MIYIVLSLQAALLVWSYRKNRGLGNAAVFVNLLYTLSFISAITMTLVEDYKLTLEATTYFVGTLFLFNIPLASSKAATISNCPQLEWKPMHDVLALGIGLVGSYSTLTTLPLGLQLLVSGQLGDMRDAMYRGAQSGIMFSSLIASGVWPVSLVFFIFSLACGRPAIQVLPLAVGSFAGATTMLAAAGRSGIISFGITLVIALCLASPLIKLHRPVLHRLLLVSVLVIVAGVGFLTVFIALLRSIGASGNFSNVTNSPVLNSLYSLVIYAGCSIINFQDFWFIYDDFGANLEGQRSFPVFYGVAERLGIVNDYDAEEINSIYKPYYDAYNLQHSVFSGFQRELMMDFGPFGFFLIATIWFAVVTRIRRRYEARIDLLSITMMTFVASVPGVGIFFLNYGELHGNISIATFAFTMLVLYAGAKKNQKNASMREVSNVQTFGV